LLLVCGLGNKGAAYRNTRHNIGYLVVDRLSEKADIPFARKVAGCVLGEGAGVLLAKADTFMNLSGTPLSGLMKKKNVAPEDLLVVHDDLDMEFGRIKIRWDGGDGGHKGVRSIADNLQTPMFYRMKIGIGRDPDVPPEEYVLSRFHGEEARALKPVIDRAVEAIDVFRAEGAEKAMNFFNR
jgi:PTH1 family peptidyl-tRNA hydrolase